jgi:hypothetical protein
MLYLNHKKNYFFLKLQLFNPKVSSIFYNKLDFCLSLVVNTTR